MAIPDNPTINGKPVTVSEWMQAVIDFAAGNLLDLDDEELREQGFAGVIEAAVEMAAMIEEDAQ